MDRWKAELGRGREKRRVEERRSEKRKSQKKADADARKGRKVAKHCVFLMVWSSGGSKSRLAKAAGAEPAGQMRDEKLHAVVARSTFRSENVQNTSSVGPLLQVEMSKSKCTEHFSLAPLLEVEMSKKCTPLWREAHLEVKMLKTLGVWTTLGGSDVEKVHAIVARSTPRSQNVKNTVGLDHFWRFRCRFASLQYTTLHYATLHYATLHSTTLHYTTLQLQLHNYTPPYSTTLHYTTLHYTTLHYTTLHYITLHYTTFHYTSLHYTSAVL